MGLDGQMKYQTKVWKTKHGDQVRVEEMSDRHLCNTIAMLMRIRREVDARQTRYHEWLRMWILSLTSEVENRVRSGIIIEDQTLEGANQDYYDRWQGGSVSGRYSYAPRDFSRTNDEIPIEPYWRY